MNSKFILETIRLIVASVIVLFGMAIIFPLITNFPTFFENQIFYYKSAAGGFVIMWIVLVAKTIIKKIAKKSGK